jgi:creatine kinase
MFTDVQMLQSCYCFISKFHKRPTRKYFFSLRMSESPIRSPRCEQKDEDEAADALKNQSPRKELDPMQDLILDSDLAENRYPAEKIQREKDSLAENKHCSHMAEYISPEMFERYKDLTSGGNGNWTFARAINTGVQFPRAYMGIHAGDPESYDTYIDMYRPCVERYHTGFKWDIEHAHRTDLNVDHVDADLTDLASSMIVSSRIRVARNLGAPFTMNPNGTGATRVAVLNMVRQCVETFPPELAGTVYAHADMTPEEEQQLIDDHILFKGRDARQAACGYHQFWPAGRGVFCSSDKSFNMWINEGDHLRIMCLFLNSDIKGVLAKLSTGIAAMESAISEVTGNPQPIATHPILGCITCCPTNLGTGCRASVMMDLPNLMKRLGLHGIDEICAQNHCQARGSTGEFSAVTEGHRCDISNRYRLGYSEAELVSQMIRTANLLAEEEAKG